MVNIKHNCLMKYSNDSAWGNDMELFIKRGLAFIIDYMIVIIPASILMLAFGIVKLILSILPILNVLSDFIWLSAIAFFIYVVYEVVCLTLFSRTIGKMIMGLRIKQNNSYELDFITILIRSIVKVLFISGYFIWIVIINMLFVLGKNQHRSIHDWIAGTSVWGN